VSFRVLIVPEDPTFNGAILRPLFERMLKECEKPRARVEVLTDPWVRGYAHAKSVVDDLRPENTGANLVLFCPDRDGVDKSAELKALEERSLGAGVSLLCCAAVEEVEAWLLAGHGDKIGANWSDVRSDASVKESVFLPFMEAHGTRRSQDGGRGNLMRETLANYAGLKARCPELAELEDRIRRHVGGA
jgi:hypothetical protein